MKTAIVVFVASSLTTALAAAQTTIAVPTPVEQTANGAPVHGGDPLLPDDGEKLNEHLKSYSGVVNVIRKSDRVEVVFRGGDVYYLPRGSKQAAIFKALEESERTNSEVGILVDQRSGVIQSVKSTGGGGRKSQ